MTSDVAILISCILIFSSVNGAIGDGSDVNIELGADGAFSGGDNTGYMMMCGYRGQAVNGGIYHQIDKLEIYSDKAIVGGQEKQYTSDLNQALWIEGGRTGANITPKDLLTCAWVAHLPATRIQ